MKELLTIFTPTYNRGRGTLSRLYESLVRQTRKNFVWLIIDDGSTDNTKAEVEKWQRDNKIKIQYQYKTNGGKHTAIELANKICETDYICCCDSDDYMSDDAVEIIYNYIERFGNDEEVVGFVGRNAKLDGTAINENWTEQSKKICFYDLGSKYHYNEDTVLIFKTKIIKEFHFPIFEGEKFITESVFYKQFLYKYKMVTIMEYIHLIEYLPTGYSAQGKNLFYKNPKGLLYRRKMDAYCEIKYGKSLKERLKRVTMYYVCKSTLALRENIASEYKIKFPYNLWGNLTKLLFLPKSKRDYKNFLLKQ